MNTPHLTAQPSQELTGRNRRGKSRFGLALAAILVMFTLVASACADDSDSGTGDDTGSEEARVIDVSATSFEFDPSEITISAGEEVVISLTSDDIEHDFVVDEANFEVTSPVGETTEGTLQIDDAGTYIYYCSIPGHREAGMEGTLTVE